MEHVDLINVWQMKGHRKTELVNPWVAPIIQGSEVMALAEVTDARQVGLIISMVLVVIGLYHLFVLIIPDVKVMALAEPTDAHPVKSSAVMVLVDNAMIPIIPWSKVVREEQGVF